MSNFDQCPDCGQWLHKTMDICPACGRVIEDEEVEEEDEFEL